MKFRITTPKDETTLECDNKKTARNFFLEVCKHLNIKEIWYFGLYYGKDGEKIWIDASRKKMARYKPVANLLRFEVKYFPEDVLTNLIMDLTVTYFYLQLNAAILTEELYCPSDKCVLLASYACMLEFGEYDGSIDLSGEILLPKRILEQHRLSKRDFDNAIISMWRKHEHLTRREAMMDYLAITQDLEMFGVHYFSIRNSRGTTLELGVYPLGLNIYQLNNRQVPIIMFPWYEITRLDFKDNMFIIEMVGKNSKKFKFRTEKTATCKRILNLGIGYHQLFLKSRRPDTQEIKRLRLQAAEEILQANRITNLSKKTTKTTNSTSQTTTNRADKPKSSTSNTSVQPIPIVAQEVVLRPPKEKSKPSTSKSPVNTIPGGTHQAALSASELQSKPDQVYSNVTRSLNNIDADEEEDHLTVMKRQFESLIDNSNSRKLNEDEQRELDSKLYQMWEKIENLERSRQNGEKSAVDNTTNMTSENRKNEEEREEFNRLAAAAQMDINHLSEVSGKLQDQIDILRRTLDATRLEEKSTKEDIIHRTSILGGKDKYSTLREIRRGNTNRRIEMFENF